MPAYGVTVESNTGSGKLRRITVETLIDAPDSDKAFDIAEEIAESIFKAAGQVVGEIALEADGTY